jgi:hypothetical protein
MTLEGYPCLMMTRSRRSALLLLFIAGSAAAPAIVITTSASATAVSYLDCQLPSRQGPRVAKLVMDEDHKLVVYQLPSQKLATTLPATFTAREVTFVLKDSAGENTFSVNRFSLAVQRYKQTGSKRSDIAYGSCSVAIQP